MGKAIFVAKAGDAGVLELRDHDPGPPAPGQVRVALRAAGVNFIDVYFRTGAYPQKMPFVAGLEGAGVIETLGEGVQGIAVGQRVAWSSVPGSYATHVLALPAGVVPVPDGVADDVAAACMLQGMTAHYLAHGSRTTHPGDTALVHAAAGGVGLLLIQMLVRAGARVIGTCSSEEKAALARAAGAEEVVLYTESDFVAATRRWTAGAGVDVVYDSVGKTTFDGSLACLRPRGLVVLFGQSSGPVPPLDLQRLNQMGSLFVTRPSLFHYTATRAELEMRSGTVLSAIDRGELSVRIGARFPLARAADAHRALEGRTTTGKVILLP